MELKELIRNKIIGELEEARHPLFHTPMVKHYKELLGLIGKHSKHSSLYKVNKNNITKKAADNAQEEIFMKLDDINKKYGGGPDKVGRIGNDPDIADKMYQHAQQHHDDSDKLREHPFPAIRKSLIDHDPENKGIGPVDLGR